MDTKDLSFEDFAQNTLIVDAVIRNLEVIGEASKNIPEDHRTRYNTIPWKRVTGFRNIAIHAYFDVDIQIVWTIATQGLLEIKTPIMNMLKDLEQKES